MFERLTRLIENSLPIRYLLNGMVATTVHYTCLTFALRENVISSAGEANFFAAIFGIATSFLGSRYFVFHEFCDTLLRQLGRFMLLYGLVACLHALLLFAWTDVMGLNYTAGFLIGIVLQTTVSYFGNRYLVFKKSEIAHDS